MILKFSCSFLLLSGYLFSCCIPWIGRAGFLRCLRSLRRHKFSPKTRFFMSSGICHAKHHKEGLKQLFNTASACMLNESYMMQGSDLAQVLESCFLTHCNYFYNFWIAEPGLLSYFNSAFIGWNVVMILVSMTDSIISQIIRPMTIRNLTLVQMSIMVGTCSFNTFSPTNTIS